MLKLLFPTNVPYITQRFGVKSSAYLTYHHGTDFRVWNDPKKEIKAVADGTVMFVDVLSVGNWYDGTKYINGRKCSVYGIHCVIRHFIDDVVYFTLYGHLSKLFVSGGQAVKAGEVLGEGGNTGKSKGQHLHFELRKKSNIYLSAINAEEFFVLPDLPSDWAKEGVDWCVKNSLTHGGRPHDTVTREEMFVMLHRLWKNIKGNE